MAVKSLMKSSGWAALAVGIAAMALPAAASAQTMSKSEFLQQRQAAQQEQRQTRQEQRQAPPAQVAQQSQNNARNWQGRGNGEARGNGGNWQNRGDGGSRTGNWSPGRPQAQNQVQSAPQRVQRSRNGGDQTVQRQFRRQQPDGDRTVQRRRDNADQATQNRRWDGNRDGRRYDGNRDGRRWDNNRDGRRYSWDNTWRRDNRYNWYNYRNTNRNVFRLGRYYSPYSSWSYRRLNIGFFLEPLFYGSSYWLDDPWQYRLPPAYGSYRWVRYYDDALLVDIYTGEVVDVIYDFFW